MTDTRALLKLRRLRRVLEDEREVVCPRSGIRFSLTEVIAGLRAQAAPSVGPRSECSAEHLRSAGRVLDVFVTELAAADPARLGPDYKAQHGGITAAITATQTKLAAVLARFGATDGYLTPAERADLVTFLDQQFS